MGDAAPGLPQPLHPPPPDHLVYVRSLAQGRLWQGEILENVIQIRPTVDSVRANVDGALEVEPVPHQLVIIVSQDCDLDQDFARREAGQRGTLPNILFCDLYIAENFRAMVRDQQQLGRQDWQRRIAQNQNERFHYLERVEPQQDLQGQGLTALALDFKIYFTLPTDEVYVRLHQEIHRRCRLNTPYAEHLAHRFFKFQSRVALPRDHQIDPIVD